MKILISTLVSERNRETLDEVMRSVKIAIGNTGHECNIMVVDDESIPFDESKFTRLTSFTIAGYDEFQLHKISELRNLCMARAIDDGYDYVLFVDSDNILPPDAIDILVGSGKRDISGWYYCKNVPASSMWRPMPRDKEPFIVRAAASGCRLIHSDIFTKVKFVYANLMPEEAQFSGDIRKLGFQTWVHPGVYSDHIGGGYTDAARAYREAHINIGGM